MHRRDLSDSRLLGSKNEAKEEASWSVDPMLAFNKGMWNAADLCSDQLPVWSPPTLPAFGVNFILNVLITHLEKRPEPIPETLAPIVCSFRGGGEGGGGAPALHSSHHTGESKQSISKDRVRGKQSLTFLGCTGLPHAPRFASDKFLPECPQEPGQQIVASSNEGQLKFKEWSELGICIAVGKGITV